MTEKNLIAVLYLSGHIQPATNKMGIGAVGYVYDKADTKSVPGSPLVETSFEKITLGSDPIAKTMDVVAPKYYIDQLVSFDETYPTPLEISIASFNRVVKSLLTDAASSEIGAIQIHTKSVALGNRISSLAVTEIPLLKELSDAGVSVTLMDMPLWGGYGYTQANIMAMIAANLSNTGSIGEYFTLTNKRDYRNTPAARHPFMGFKRVYFNSQREMNTPGQYFLSDPGIKDTLIGNRSPETSFAVVKLHKGDELVEVTKKKQIDIAGHTNLISVIDVDKLYSKDNPFFLTQFGESALVKNDKLFNIEFMDKQPACVELNPSRLSPRALAAFNFLESILVQVSGGECQSNEVSNLQLEDITSIFYNSTPNGGHELKKDIVVGFKNMSVTISRNNNRGEEHTLGVPLIMGLDTPSRNHMKRLETLTPNVKLVTWDASDNCVRYCVFIQCVDGIGVWSNYFSDRIFINVSKK